MSDFFKRVPCLLFGHRYVLTQKLTEQSRRIACTRCRRMFAMNDDVRAVVEWDSTFHRLYETFGVKIKYRDWEASHD